MSADIGIIGAFTLFASISCRGLAIFTPSIDGQGNVSGGGRVDKRITFALNAPGAFNGRINNSDNIGKSSLEIAEIWNAANPGNPVEVEQGIL